MPATQGMEKPSLTRCQSSSELRNMWAFLAERDFATDCSAAGMKAQAERGKGNGETTAKRAQHSSVSLAPATSQRALGRIMTVPKPQQRLPGRAGAGVAARMMMMKGGDGRAESARGRFGDNIFSWEKRSWADSCFRHIKVLSLHPSHGCGEERGSWPCWNIPKQLPRNSSPAGRCSLASPRRVPFPPPGAEGGLGPWKEEFPI